MAPPRIRSLLPWLIALAVSAGCGDCRKRQPVPEMDWELQGLYQRGNQALADGKYTVAESELRKVLDKDAKHLGALTKLAQALMGRAAREPAARRKFLLDEALGLLDKATRVDPESRVAWSQLAQVARQADQPERALSALQHLWQLDPKDSATLVAIAELKLEQGQAQAAEQTFRQGLDGDKGAVRLAFGRFLLDQGRANEARELWAAIPACPEPDEDLKRPDPCPTAAYYEAQDELGSLAVRQGRLDDARRVYTGLVEMFPEDYMAWEVLAALDEKAGDYPAAEEKYRQSLAVDRVHMSVWRGLGRCLKAQDKREDAVFAFRKADHFLAKSPAQAVEMADELADLGERAWAKSLLERARILAQDQAAVVAAIDRKLAQLAAAPKSSDVPPAPDGGVQP